MRRLAVILIGVFLVAACSVSASPDASTETSPSQSAALSPPTPSPSIPTPTPAPASTPDPSYVAGLRQRAEEELTRWEDAATGAQILADTAARIACGMLK